MKLRRVVPVLLERLEDISGGGVKLRRVVLVLVLMAGMMSVVVDKALAAAYAGVHTLACPAPASVGDGLGGHPQQAAVCGNSDMGGVAHAQFWVKYVTAPSAGVRLFVATGTSGDGSGGGSWWPVGMGVRTCLRYHHVTGGQVQYFTVAGVGTSPPDGLNIQQGSSSLPTLTLGGSGTEGAMVDVGNASGGVGTTAIEGLDYWYPLATVAVCSVTNDPSGGAGGGGGSPVACATWAPQTPGQYDSIVVSGTCSGGTADVWRYAVDGGAVSSYAGLSVSRTIGPLTVASHALAVTVKDSDTGTTGSASYTVVVSDTGGASGGSGTDCGAWWHVLCYIESAISWLFVPDAGHQGLISGTWASFTTKLPFSIAAAAVTAIPAVVGQVNDAFTAEYSLGHCWTLWGSDLGTVGESGGGGVPDPSGTGGPEVVGGVCPSVWNVNGLTAQSGFVGPVGVLRGILLTLYLVGLAFGLWRLAQWVIAR